MCGPCPSFDGKRVWVTSHADRLGAAIVRRLWRQRCEILLASSRQLDLTQPREVEAWVARARPDVIFLVDAPLAEPDPRTDDMRRGAEARRGAATANVLSAARKAGVATLVNPRQAPAPQTAPASGWRSATGPSVLTPAPSAAMPAIRCSADARDSHCIFLLTEPPPQTVQPLSRLHRRLREAALVREDEVRIDCAGTWLGVPDADDVADAACFLAASYDGLDPVRLAAEDVGPIDETLALVAELAGYKGRLLVHPPRRGVEAVGMRTLGWRPSVPLRDRIGGLRDGWLQSVSSPSAAMH